MRKKTNYMKLSSSTFVFLAWSTMINTEACIFCFCLLKNSPLHVFIFTLYILSLVLNRLTIALLLTRSQKLTCLSTVKSNVEKDANELELFSTVYFQLMQYRITTHFLTQQETGCIYNLLDFLSIKSLTLTLPPPPLNFPP